MRADGVQPAAVGLRLSVLNAEAFRFPEPWAFPPAELPYTILRLIRAGTGEIEFDGIRCRVRPGDLVLIPEGAVLKCRSTSADFAFGSIRFAASAEARDWLLGPAGVPGCSDAGTLAEVRASFDAVIAAWEKKSAGRSLLSAGHLAVVLGLAADHAAASGAARPVRLRDRAAQTRVRDPRITRILEHLAADLRRTPDAAELCALTHMSESTLRRTFKEHTGKTIGEHLRELRMADAARRLAFGDEPIRQIATDVGLPDANYFARAFRELFRLSPSEYRNLVRET